MATNKHATIRYLALDRCFNNPGKRFYMNDLINECASAIRDFSGIDDGIKKRQVYNDIKFMESEQGWAIPLERHKDSKGTYFRYRDNSFSIRGKGINQMEAERITDALSILSRFSGLPQFEWIEEISIRLQDSFHLKGNSSVTVGFEQNPYLKGLNHFSRIFMSIQNKETIQVTYQGFREVTANKIIFHPWFLKQYNNRWFVFGFNEYYQSVSNLALDRIISIEFNSIPYKVNSSINFEEYFDDVVGVTVKSSAPNENITLEVNIEIWPYIASKPLHGSQKVKLKGDNTVIVELNLQINYELISILCSFMETIVVIKPEALRSIVKNKADALIKKYI